MDFLRQYSLFRTMYVRLSLGCSFWDALWLLHIVSLIRKIGSLKLDYPVYDFRNLLPHIKWLEDNDRETALEENLCTEIFTSIRDTYFHNIFRLRKSFWVSWDFNSNNRLFNSLLRWSSSYGSFYWGSFVKAACPFFSLCRASFAFLIIYSYFLLHIFYLKLLLLKFLIL